MVRNVYLFSGRCLLSDYFTNGERKKLIMAIVLSRADGVTSLLKETRPGQYYEINQDDRGSHIFES